MKSVKAPFFLRWLSPGYLVCDIPAPEKIIYLTFDDGPIPEITPEILTILAEFNARATFFVVGDNVRKYPEIFHEVVAAGHATGNHTFHHLNGWVTSPGAYIEDVRRCDELINSPLFRPPYGRFTPAQFLLLRKQYRFVLWSVLSWDFDRKTSPEQCLKNVIDYSTAGSVVVFHDSQKAIEKVRFALPRFLERFMSLGYRFQAIGSRQ
jgi:peptidoglycan/xylan/chitin deacetylase (PgdA/CDA1 family)